MERSVLVFEDLSGSNFVHADKVKGFDEEHMTMSIKWLAKWHAATAVLLLKVIYTLNLHLITGWFSNFSTQLEFFTASRTVRMVYKSDV